RSAARGGGGRGGGGGRAGGGAAAGGGGGGGRVLSAPSAAAGGPFPPRGEGGGVQPRLSSATIATFHGFCAGLLRRAPQGSGAPAAFELLDEEESLELLEELAERLVLERLEAADAAVEPLSTHLHLPPLPPPHPAHPPV